MSKWNDRINGNEQFIKSYFNFNFTFLSPFWIIEVVIFILLWCVSQICIRKGKADISWFLFTHEQSFNQIANLVGLLKNDLCFPPYWWHGGKQDRIEYLGDKDFTNLLLINTISSSINWKGQCIISGRPLTSSQFSRLVSPLTDCSAWVVIKRSPSPDINRRARPQFPRVSRSPGHSQTQVTYNNLLRASSPCLVYYNIYPPLKMMNATVMCLVSFKN